jgi:hypothetical protein
VSIARVLRRLAPLIVGGVFLALTALERRRILRDPT